MRTMRPTQRFSVFGQMLLGLVVVSVLLGGCAALPRGDTQAVDVAKVVQSYDCLAPNLGGWETPPDPTITPDPQHPDAPDAGRVPADFTPTKAVRCDQMASITDAEGQWSAVAAVTLTGDFTPLLAALAEPDDGIGPGPCTADMELVSPLWLLDTNGQAIRVHYPRNSCGKTKPGVHKAIAGLSVQDTTTLKRFLVVPRAALDSQGASDADGSAALQAPSRFAPDDSLLVARLTLRPPNWWQKSPLPHRFHIPALCRQQCF